jgi:hypothetical protein
MLTANSEPIVPSAPTAFLRSVVMRSSTGLTASTASLSCRSRRNCRRIARISFRAARPPRALIASIGTIDANGGTIRCG